MNDFLAFAAAHGLVINRLIPDGKIHRVPTTDKPSSDNGAYMMRGDSGWVQNWATDPEVVPFRTDKPRDPAVAARIRRQNDEEMQAQEARYDAAAARARAVVARAKYTHHPYFALKDLHGTQGLVDTDGRLVVPMRHWRTGEIQSVQWIDNEGGKRFLPEGRTKGGVFSMGPAMASPWLVEGRATGESVMQALRKLYRQDRVVVCFSAGNLKYVAGQIGACRIVADNDESGTGEAAALASGKPWVMPPVVGDDANDYASRAGVRALADLMRTLL